MRHEMAIVRHDGLPGANAERTEGAKTVLTAPRPKPYSTPPLGKTRLDAMPTRNAVRTTDHEVRATSRHQGALGRPSDALAVLARFEAPTWAPTILERLRSSSGRFCSSGARLMTQDGRFCGSGTRMTARGRFESAGTPESVVLRALFQEAFDPAFLPTAVLPTAALPTVAFPAFFRQVALPTVAFPTFFPEATPRQPPLPAAAFP